MKLGERMGRGKVLSARSDPPSRELLHKLLGGLTLGRSMVLDWLPPPLEESKTAPPSPPPPEAEDPEQGELGKGMGRGKVPDRSLATRCRLLQRCRNLVKSSLIHTTTER